MTLACRTAPARGPHARSADDGLSPARCGKQHLAATSRPRRRSGAEDTRHPATAERCVDPIAIDEHVSERDHPPSLAHTLHRAARSVVPLERPRRSRPPLGTGDPMFATVTARCRTDARRPRPGCAGRAAAAGTSDPADCAAATGCLVRELLVEQESAGLEPLTDGQARTVDLGRTVVRALGSEDVADPTAVGWRRRSVRGWRFAAESTPRAVKAGDAGAVQPGSSLRGRGSAHDLTLALADALADELAALAAAAARSSRWRSPRPSNREDRAERELFVGGAAPLLRHIGETHVSLAVVGGDASAAGEETFFATPTRRSCSISSPGPTTGACRARPGARGIVFGALDPDDAIDAAMLVWAAHYAASTVDAVSREWASRPRHRSWADPRTAGQKLRVLGEAARIAAAGPWTRSPRARPARHRQPHRGVGVFRPRLRPAPPDPVTARRSTAGASRGGVLRAGPGCWTRSSALTSRWAGGAWSGSWSSHFTGRRTGRPQRGSSRCSRTTGRGYIGHPQRRRGVGAQPRGGGRGDARRRHARSRCVRPASRALPSEDAVIHLAPRQHRSRPASCTGRHAVTSWPSGRLPPGADGRLTASCRTRAETACRLPREWDHRFPHPTPHPRAVVIAS